MQATVHWPCCACRCALPHARLGCGHVLPLHSLFNKTLLRSSVKVLFHQLLVECIELERNGQHIHEHYSFIHSRLAARPTAAASMPPASCILLASLKHPCRLRAPRHPVRRVTAAASAMPRGRAVVRQSRLPSCAACLGGIRMQGA